MKFCYLIILFFVVSCSTKSELSIEDFMEYIQDEENGLFKTQTLNGVKYEVTLLPSELRNYMHFKETGKKIKKSNLIGFRYKIALENNKDILKAGISTIKDFNMELMYLNTNMSRDFKLINGSDTLYNSLFVPEYIDGITPYIMCNIVFPALKINKSENITLVYEDKLFSDEKICFQFDKKTLIDLPKIK